MKSTVDYLSVVTGFSSEDNYTVWNDIIANLSKVGTLLQYTPSDLEFRRFCVNLLTPIGEKVGWEKEKDEGILPFRFSFYFHSI